MVQHGRESVSWATGKCVWGSGEVEGQGERVTTKRAKIHGTESLALALDQPLALALDHSLALALNQPLALALD